MGCWKRIKDSCLRPCWGFWIWFVIILVVSLGILCFVSDPTLWDAIPDRVIKDCNNGWVSKDSAEIFLYWFTGVATAFMVVIAYYKIGQINKDDTAKFFLQLDQRWTDEQILHAKHIITALRIHYNDNMESIMAKISDICALRKVPNEAKIIKEITDAGINKRRAEIAALLVNFLDYLETIGFLYAKGYIDLQSVDEICGESLADYYKIFSSYIENQRKISGNESMYKCFQNLAKELKQGPSLCQESSRDC